MKRIKPIFEDIGWQFISPIETIQEKLKGIKDYIFDWDGVLSQELKAKISQATTFKWIR